VVPALPALPAAAPRGRRRRARPARGAVRLPLHARRGSWRPSTTTSRSDRRRSGASTSARSSRTLAPLPRPRRIQTSACESCHRRGGGWSPPCRLRLSAGPARSHTAAGSGELADPVRAGERSLANSLVEVAVAADGTLQIAGGGAALAGVSRLVDGGDAGDSYSYASPTVNGLVSEPEDVSVTVRAAGPVVASSRSFARTGGGSGSGSGRYRTKRRDGGRRGHDDGRPSHR
jgi:hypothetical protein